MKRASARRSRAGLALSGTAVGVGLYLGAASGKLTIDLGIGRRIRPLGPLELHVDAPREVVFDVIAGPYLQATPRAMAEKLRVLERGSELVLAEHVTAVRGRLQAVTLETVRFVRPERVEFRLVRGPVPNVTERFDLAEVAGATMLRYVGEIGADLWLLGGWWMSVVAPRWVAAVEESFASIKAEAERRAAVHRS